MAHVLVSMQHARASTAGCNCFLRRVSYFRQLFADVVLTKDHFHRQQGHLLFYLRVKNANEFKLNINLISVTR